LTNDSLADLVVGNQAGGILLYQNNGNRSSFNLTSIPTQLFPGNALPGGAPCLIDWNRDCLLDLLIGNEVGQLLLAMNVGTGDNPSFSAPLSVQIATRLRPEQLMPIPEMEGFQIIAALANALIYVVMVLIGGIFILALVKFGRFRTITVLFASLTGIACFSLGVFFFAAIGVLAFNSLLSPLVSLPQAITQQLFDSSVILASFLFAGVAVLATGIGVLGRPLRNIILIIFGAMFGSLLGIHFPLWSTALILIGLALYDIFAVFRGPIKGIFDSGERHLVQPEPNGAKNGAIVPSVAEAPETTPPIETEPLLEQVVPEKKAQRVERVSILSLTPALPLYSWGEVSIGLGDFAFYSLLISHALFEGLRVVNSLLPVILAFAGIIAGALVTFKILERGSRALPGLPLPIGLGLAGMILGLVWGSFLPL